MTSEIKKYQNALQLLDSILCECCKERILAAFPLQSPSKKWEGSLENIAYLYRSGKTYQEIGDIYGVTREWIRRVLKHTGVTSRDGGAAVSARMLAQKKEDQKNRRSLEKHGCLCFTQLCRRIQNADISLQHRHLDTFA